MQEFDIEKEAVGVTYHASGNPQKREFLSPIHPKIVGFRQSPVKHQGRFGIWNGIYW